MSAELATMAFFFLLPVGLISLGLFKRDWFGVNWADVALRGAFCMVGVYLLGTAAVVVEKIADAASIEVTGHVWVYLRLIQIVGHVGVYVWFFVILITGVRNYLLEKKKGREDESEEDE